MTKPVKDMQHASMVNAWVLVNDQGHYKGRMIANWSNSGVCHFMAQVYVEGKGLESAQASAGGWGYDKLGAAAARALQALGFKNDLLRNAANGAGFELITEFIESLNYKLHKAC